MLVYLLAAVGVVVVESRFGAEGFDELGEWVLVSLVEVSLRRGKSYVEVSWTAGSNDFVAGPERDVSL